MKRKTRVITKVFRVNWFVACVNWAKELDSSWILSVVVIVRFVRYVIRESRIFA